MDKEVLLSNIDKVHTTEMGIDRIKKNLKLDTDDVVEYCKNKVLDKNLSVSCSDKLFFTLIEFDNSILLKFASFNFPSCFSVFSKFSDIG